MKTKLLYLIAALTCVLFTHCADNPADGVAEAKVEETKPADSASPAAGPPASEATKYTFAEGSTIEFTGSKVTGSHSGGFKKFDGYFSIAGEQIAGSDHKVVIDMKSTYSDSEKLTGHLKAPDFFDVEKFPTLTFALDSIEKGEGQNYTLGGELTLHGVTKRISFPAEITGDASQFNLNAEFVIKRFDFDIVYPGKADDLIRDEVVIVLKLQAVPG